ncbi:MAG: formate/nitrite transporter family protein [Bacteroidales bacterium]
MPEKVKKLKHALNRPKTIDEILNEQIQTAMHEHDRPNLNLFLSSISAGLEIGFSIFLMAAVQSLFSGVVHPSLLHVLLAMAYPLGFIFVIIGKSELFTEHTTLAVIPVLNRNVTLKKLLVLWGIVYGGNLLGGYAFGYILSLLPGRMEVLDQGAFEVLARKLTDHPWNIILGSGILAGWLMGLLSWLITSARETISRILLVGMITTVIGIGGLHHSIVGSIEVFTAILTGKAITWSDYFTVQLWATVGNIIGGVVFVAFIKFSHATGAKPTHEAH